MSEWGVFSVGDLVTSFGRHGIGQPAIEGRVKEIVGPTVYVSTDRGLFRRSINNLRCVRKAMTEQEIKDHVEFLEETLIPDLMESGHEATADDFVTCVTIIKQLDERRTV